MKIGNEKRSNLEKEKSYCRIFHSRLGKIPLRAIIQGISRYGGISVLVYCDLSGSFSGSLDGSLDSFSGFGIFIGGILGSLNFSLPSPPNVVPKRENNAECDEIGRSCPSQYAQPLGAKVPGSSLISPMNGSDSEGPGSILSL